MKKNRFLFITAITALALAVSCKTPPGSSSRPQLFDESPQRTRSGPELRVIFSPQYFSPDGDKEELAIYLFAVDEYPIDKWSIEIREPQPPYPLFYQWEGEGHPPETLRWNGRSRSGELVQSALDYPFVFTASNSQGNTSSIETVIEVDVIVLKEGSNLRIQIPSIVFRSNSSTWDGLDDDIVDSNYWILQRLAQILNKFGDYRINVEGHANPTANPDDRAAWLREQEQELKPLSESRAKKIVDELVMLGINPGRLSYYGLGGERPLVRWEDTDNWWKNRRVEFLLIK